MAAIEFTEETKRQVERIGSADVVVGIAGTVAAGRAAVRAEQIVAELGSEFVPAPHRVCVGRAERVSGRRRRGRGERGQADGGSAAFYVAGSGERGVLVRSFGASASGAGAGGLAQGPRLHCAGSGSGGAADACAAALHLCGSRPPVRAGDAHLSGRQIRRADQYRDFVAAEPGFVREADPLPDRVRLCRVGSHVRASSAPECRIEWDRTILCCGR